jgi:hypothetical protein
MKIGLFAASLFVLGVCATAIYTNFRMYKEIETTFATAPQFKKSIGRFQNAVLVKDGDCTYGVSCRLTFKVWGEEGCIYAIANVEEKFPTYSVLSISPDIYTETIIDNASNKKSTIKILKCASNLPFNSESTVKPSIGVALR